MTPNGLEEKIEVCTPFTSQHGTGAVKVVIKTVDFSKTGGCIAVLVKIIRIALDLFELGFQRFSCSRIHILDPCIECISHPFIGIRCLSLHREQKTECRSQKTERGFKFLIS